ncbi:MAG: hypothetical protein ACKVXR_15845 [Planctomycetota bacterium]
MDVTSAFAVIVGLSVFFAVVYALGFNERVKKRLVCPNTGLSADVEIARRYDEPHREVRVESCSLLPRPNHVDCGQACLKRDS